MFIVEKSTVEVSIKRSLPQILGQVSVSLASQLASADSDKQPLYLGSGVRTTLPWEAVTSVGDCLWASPVPV